MGGSTRSVDNDRGNTQRVYVLSFVMAPAWLVFETSTSRHRIEYGVVEMGCTHYLLFMLDFLRVTVLFGIAAI